MTTLFIYKKHSFLKFKHPYPAKLSFPSKLASPALIGLGQHKECEEKKKIKVKVWKLIWAARRFAGQKFKCKSAARKTCGKKNNKMKGRDKNDERRDGWYF